MALQTSETVVAPPSGVLNVLVADDDADSREMLRAAVQHLGHTCTVAGDGLEALELHRTLGADVILSDWSMPELDGIRLCRKIRQNDSELAYTHFIFVTGNDDKARFLEGMHAGADDYLTKPIQLDELAARLEVARRAVMLHRQLLATNSLLRRKGDRDSIAARTDPLTAVSNRLQLTEDLDLLASRVFRYGHRYCAALCDIDSFKAYNDCFGHLGGDDVLRRVASTIQDHLRSGDGFYRYGGEEFLAILPEQTLAEAEAGMERVRLEVERLGILHSPAAKQKVVTISMGIAELNPSSEGSVDDWLRRTDAALYAAKARGRNRVVLESDLPPRPALTA
jgi:diguanylate cyclase (GGDEF)-like protein